LFWKISAALEYSCLWNFGFLLFKNFTFCFLVFYFLGGNFAHFTINIVQRPLYRNVKHFFLFFPTYFTRHKVLLLNKVHVVSLSMLITMYICLFTTTPLYVESILILKCHFSLMMRPFFSFG